MISWTREAKLMLGKYEFHVRDGLKEFSNMVPSIEVTPTLHVSSMLRERYSIIWSLDKERIRVEAVVPTQFSPDTPKDRLFEQIKRVVLSESCGRVSLVKGD